jgi:CysZ protein
MVTALLRALCALAMPPLRRVVALGLGLSASTFALLSLAVGAVLYRTAFFAWQPLDWLVDALGGLSILALSWLLFPAVVTLFLGFFVNRVAAAVEAADYPGKGPARHQPWGEAAAAALRLAAVTIGLNLLALPLYLLVPGINCVLFLTLNGYLFGRGYFETVALRRLDAAAAESARRRFAGRIFLGGVMITGLFAIPLVNLVAPVIATAFMIHVFEALPGGAPHSGGRSAV